MRCGVVGVLRNGDLFRCLSKGNHRPHVFKGDVSGSACRRGNNHCQLGGRRGQCQPPYSLRTFGLCLEGPWPPASRETLPPYRCQLR